MTEGIVQHCKEKQKAHCAQATTECWSTLPVSVLFQMHDKNSRIVASKVLRKKKKNSSGQGSASSTNFAQKSACRSNSGPSQKLCSFPWPSTAYFLFFIFIVSSHRVDIKVLATNCTQLSHTLDKNGSLYDPAGTESWNMQMQKHNLMQVRPAGQAGYPISLVASLDTVPVKCCVPLHWI